jgi:hypothetical protein
MSNLLQSDNKDNDKARAWIQGYDRPELQKCGTTLLSFH